MKAIRTAKWTAVLLITTFMLMYAAAAMAEPKTTTVVGEVNDNFQIVSGDKIYEIADTAEGNDLAENHISAKVKVTGTLEERDDIKIITVTAYEVLSE